MRPQDYFGRDVRRAHNASTLRRVISYAPMTVVVILSIVFADRLNVWVWLSLVLGILILDAILGNRWANQDALEDAELSDT